MEAQFNDKFTVYYQNKTQKNILSEEKYEQIVSTIQKYTGIKLEDLYQKQAELEETKRWYYSHLSKMMKKFKY